MPSPHDHMTATSRNMEPLGPRSRGGHRKPKPEWKTANDLVPRYDSTTETDTSADEAGTTSQPLRSMNMNTYASQPGSRPAPRLQNTQKSAIGNGGWGGFGMPSSGSAFGGLGSAPGLGGQARPGQLSGFAQVMGGGTGQGPIDMSDFPSLSGGPRPQQNTSNAASWNSNAIRQPSAQQQSQAQQGQPRAPSAAPSHNSVDPFDGQRSQQPSADRSGGGEEFPPLGGQLNGDAIGQSNGFSGGLSSPDIQQPRTNGQQAQLPIRENSGTFSSTQQQPPIGQQPTQQQQPQTQPSQNGQAPQPTPGVKKYADMTENEKWGLPGLTAAYEARKQAESGGQVDETLPLVMRSAVIMGHDLTNIGLDLDSPEPLYSTFTPFQAPGSSQSTFDFHERHVVPDFTLPNAYTVTNVPSLSSRMSAFSDETLFSVFYQHPRDVLQELAAHELISREWRWHKLIRQWLQKDTGPTSSSSLPLIDLTNGAPIGAPPIRTSERGEKGVYVCFDAMNWRRERRVLELDYEHLDAVARVPVVPNSAAPSLNGPGRLNADARGEGGVGSSQVPGA